MLRSCPAHGAFDGERCPTCSHPGDPLVDEERRTQLSKFLSGALRHFPDDVGLELDEAGWTSLPDLIDAATHRYGWAQAPEVRAVLALDPKGRFETDGDQVRATYGHSVDVDVDARQAGPIPSRLFHGTPEANLSAIRAEGLKPMGRQAVHLSPDVQTAREVGLRHAEHVAILAVDADGLQADGIEVRRRAETVYTCQRAPPEHLDVVEDG